MKIHKLAVICLSAFFVIAGGCSMPNGEKAASSGTGSAAENLSSESPSSISPEISSPQSTGSGLVSSEQSQTNLSSSVTSKIETDCWVEKASMSTPRFDFGSAVVNGKIYVFGGLTTDDYHGTNSAEVYNPMSNQWTKIASMPVGLYSMQVAVLDGKIYSIGGKVYDEKNYNTSVTVMEKYDPITNSWTKSASCPIQNGYTIAALNGNIYAMGGEDYNGNPLGSVEAYDPSKNTWTKKASMRTPRESFKTEIIEGKIWAIGTFDSLAGASVSSGSMEIYNLIKNQWTKKAGTCVNRDGFHVAVVGDKLFVLGGWDPHSNGGTMDGVFTSVEEYDPATDKWIMKAPMIEKKTFFQTVVVNGKIYVIGGGNDLKYGNQAKNTLSSVQEYDSVTNKWTEKSSLKIGRKSFTTVVIDNNIYTIGGLVGVDTGDFGSALVEEYTAEK